MSGQIIFTEGKISFEVARDYSQIAVLTDTNTKQHCYPLIQHLLPPHRLIEVPAGEEHKNIGTCQTIWHELTHLNFDRHSLLIVLGGGVLGDMGGFCAATFKRGIDFILVPTTLLSQVDASVGGKLGIDFEHFKNQIGVFCEPKATIIHTPFLKTLPERELRSGFAEVIKHCLISDEAMWQIIRKKNLLQQDWGALVKHSVNFKKSVTETDPKEKGLRKILNFGHSIGHAVESYFLSNGNRIFHGEAIAMGMIMESFLAKEKKLINQKELDEIITYLIEIFEKETLPNDEEPVIHLMIQDKKNKDNKILMALPEGIGKAQWNVEVSKKEVGVAFDFYRKV